MSLNLNLTGAGVVALCDHCHRQRQAAAVFGGPELEELGFASGAAFVRVAVVSGCCHDCGAGYCLCRGQFDCERCPRKNAHVVVQSLTLYQVAAPPAPSTIPAPIGG